MADHGAVNNAELNPATNVVAQFWNAQGHWLVDNRYRPMLEEHGERYTQIRANLELTGVRAADPFFGAVYREGLETDNMALAWTGYAGKAALRYTDGLDGPVMRELGLTSKFGGGFDGAVDSWGTYDDTKCMISALEYLGFSTDTAKWILKNRVATDAATIAIGGLANGAAEGLAVLRGHEIPEEDKAKANLPAKIKFTSSSVGGAIILGVPLVTPKASRERRAVIQFGMGLQVVSTISGVEAVNRYLRATGTNLKRAAAKPQNT